VQVKLKNVAESKIYFSVKLCFYKLNYRHSKNLSKILKKFHRLGMGENFRNMRLFRIAWVGKEFQYDPAFPLMGEGRAG
jgi:hypothetical protein